MLTAAVLLALEIVEDVTGYQVERSRRVRFEAECVAGRDEEVRRVVKQCEKGLYGIMVDVGRYQDAFRQVSRIVDEAREGATRKG
jgi:hypothetical protein